MSGYESKKCPNCGADNTANTNFCVQCGAKLLSEKPNTIVAPQNSEDIMEAKAIKRAKLMIIGGGIGAFLGLLLCFTGVLALIGACFIVFGVILIVLGSQITKNGKNYKIVKESGCSFIEGGILKISERKPAIANVVKIVNDKNYTVSYEPEKIHVGAVTVGGVTTGGVYKTGGYHYVSGSENSGKCKLVYLGDTIRDIQLNDELFSLAKSSSISKYLIDEKKQIQVIEPVQYTESEIRTMYSNLSSSKYMNMGAGMQEKAKQGYPTYEKCMAIMNWICGVDAGTIANDTNNEKESKTCQKCGKQNKPDDNFCTGCGEKLETK